MNYLYNSETEKKDTTTIHCSRVKLKASTPVCFILIIVLIFVIPNFQSWKKFSLNLVKNIKVRLNINWKRPIQMLYRKLQQIIVRLQKI